MAGLCGAMPCGLALTLSAYTALRAWLESSPPGFGVNVA